MATNSTCPSTSIQVPSLADSYGAFFIGTCVCLVLYGLIIHQTYRYFRLYPGDPLHLKILVVILFLVETANAVLPIHLCYYHLVANYFQPATLADDILSLRLLAPTSAITILACQGFYARRVFLVDRRHRFIVIGALVLLVVETGFAAVVSVEAFKGNQWIVSVYYGLDMAIDFTLAGTLIAFLLRNRTGAARTDSMIQTLVVYTINTGLVTSIVGMVAFVFALIKPGNLVYFAMGIIVTKLYANSVLALLNTRRYLSSMSQAIDAFDPQSTMVFNHAVCLHCNSVRGSGPQGSGSVPSSGESRSRGWSHADFQDNFEMQNPPQVHDRRKRAHAQQDDVFVT